MRNWSSWMRTGSAALPLAMMIAGCGGTPGTTPEEGDLELRLAHVSPMRARDGAPGQYAVDDEALGPRTHGLLRDGFAGHDALVSRARVHDGVVEQPETDAVSALLAPVPLDPMAIPARALADQTGLDLRVDVRMVADDETGERFVQESLLYPGSLPGAVAAPQDRRAVPPREQRIDRAQRQLEDTRDPVRLDDGTLLVYAGFAPAVPADAPSRVSWLDEALPRTRHRAVELGEAERQREIEALRAESLAGLDALELCQVVGTTRAANAAYLACTDDELLALAEQAEFVRELDVIDAGQPHGMRGDEFRADDGAQHGMHLDAWYDGRTGTTVNRPNIEVALLDGDGFYYGWRHPAFDDWSGGDSRLQDSWVCHGSGHPTAPNACLHDAVSGFPLAHGAHAMTGAFAHLLQGQDPNVTTAADQEDRSFGAYEADLELYRWTAGGAEVGLTFAADPPGADDGIDLAVVSWGSPGGCDNVDANAAWRDAWDFAYSHGAMGVISAGNTVNRLDDECSANSWATRTDLLVAGAFGDDVNTAVGLNPATPIGTWDYDTQPLMGWHWTDLSGSPNCAGTDPGCWSSAYGGGRLHYRWGGQVRDRGIVDVVAPSGRELGAHMTAPWTEVYDTQCCGTSMAAPHVASAAVSLKDWANSVGFTTFEDPGILHANMLLMGDSTRGGHDPGGASGMTELGMDWLWGAGRLKMRRFDATGMDAPWGWGTGSMYVYDGDVIDIPVGSGPVSSDVDAWTGVLAWDEPYLDAGDTTNHAADIVFQLVVTEPIFGACFNPGGFGGTEVAGDWGWDPQKRISVRAPEIQDLHGRCAWMRFWALDVPNDPDGFDRRYVYRADYYEDLDREWWEDIDDIE